LDAVDTLHHADRGGGQQPENDPEQETEAQRPPADVRKSRILRLIPARMEDRREPGGQAAP
jgi:hypothetical protein